MIISRTAAGNAPRRRSPSRRAALQPLSPLPIRHRERESTAAACGSASRVIRYELVDNHGDIHRGGKLIAESGLGVDDHRPSVNEHIDVDRLVVLADADGGLLIGERDIPDFTEAALQVGAPVSNFGVVGELEDFLDVADGLSHAISLARVNTSVNTHLGLAGVSR